jgi:two-component system, OmpR family, phosphate regulon sensor histidine kinase PhoR
MFGGVAVLGWLSLRVSRQLAHVTQQSIRDSTSALADKVVRRIEKRIIDQDRALFDLVDLQNLSNFRVFWDRITTMSSLVEGALVLDERFQIVHYASKESESQRRLFANLFTRRILAALRLQDLPPGFHMHLHTRIEDRDYLISYLYQVAGPRRFLVVLKVNLSYVLSVLLPEELQPLVGRYVAAVQDRISGRRWYGQLPGSALRNAAVQFTFPTTLYRWQVVLAPRDAAALAAQSRQRQRLNLWLSLASLLAVGLGFATLIWAMRREQQVAHLKADFASTVTHEMKTPLTLIRMYAELLAREKAGTAERRVEYAAVLTRETARLSRLIDNVLDLTRLERGLEQIRFERGDLRDVVSTAVATHRQGPLSARAEIGLELPDEVAWVELNAEALQLALLNLIENAIKYGGGHVWVSLAPEGADFVVRVADDGAGIPAEERSQLFERFFRGRRAVRSRERGSGIGLSLVRAVTEMHGGSVTAGEREGGGAELRVRLPRAASEPPPPAGK